MANVPWDSIEGRDFLPQTLLVDKASVNYIGLFLNYANCGAICLIW